MLLIDIVVYIFAGISLFYFGWSNYAAADLEWRKLKVQQAMYFLWIVLAYALIKTLKQGFVVGSNP